MLKDLLDKERESLDYFFDNFDFTAAEQLLTLLNECIGKIILTGVGKSGYIAEKIAATLISTGSRAYFLSPTNAFHGDLGIIHEGDMIIMLSKSGESDELLHLVPFMRNKGVKTIAVVNQPDSRLAKASEHTIVLPVGKELCPFNLAPTTSSVVQMIFGDLITVALMTHKNFTLADYALNHPSGRIGRRLVLRVRDLMLTGKEIPLTGPKAKLVDSLVELSDKRCGCILITDDEGVLLGIFTDGDLRRALQKHGSAALEKTMDQLMTLNPRRILPTILASEALVTMEADQKRPITVLAVVNESNKVLGLIKMHDIIQSGI